MGKTEKQLADLISKKLQLSIRTGREFVRRLLELVREDLQKTGWSELRGLGTFAVHLRPGRDTIHPTTKKPVHIPDRKAIRFRASKDVKDMIQSGVVKPKPKKPTPVPAPVPVREPEQPKAKARRRKKAPEVAVETDSPDL
jgi:nucleoid DNA-binding protein